MEVWSINRKNVIKKTRKFSYKNTTDTSTQMKLKTSIHTTNLGIELLASLMSIVVHQGIATAIAGTGIAFPFEQYTSVIEIPWSHYFRCFLSFAKKKRNPSRISPKFHLQTQKIQIVLVMILIQVQKIRFKRRKGATE